MLVDLDHLHYWMQAIRLSPDMNRTLDAFWRGQLASKEWLCLELKNYIRNPVTIDICGGWVGVLASMLFQSNISISHIRSIDIDPLCESVATMMNKIEEISGKFSAITSDMCLIQSDANVIINTSCEHITQDQYNIWLESIPIDSLIVLQSNNYKISEHVRIAESLNDFKKQSNINILWAGELKLSLYDRYMIIGKKNV